MKKISVYYNYVGEDYHHYISFWPEQNPKVELLRDDLGLSLKEYRYNVSGNVSEIYKPCFTDLEDNLKNKGDYSTIFKEVGEGSTIFILQHAEEVQQLNLDYKNLKTATYVGDFEVLEFEDNYSKKKACHIHFYSGCFKSRRAVDKYVNYKFVDEEEQSDFAESLGNTYYDPTGLCVFFGKKLQNELIEFIDSEELVEKIMKKIPDNHNVIISLSMLHDNIGLKDSELDTITDGRVNYCGKYECWI